MGNKKKMVNKKIGWWEKQIAIITTAVLITSIKMKTNYDEGSSCDCLEDRDYIKWCIQNSVKRQRSSGLSESVCLPACLPGCN